MTDEIEERLRLERFRYAALGTINAQTTMLADLWCNFIVSHHPDDALAEFERLEAHWLADAAAPTRAFPGIEPAYLDLIAQEYEEAIRRLSREMKEKLRQGPKGPRGESSGST